MDRAQRVLGVCVRSGTTGLLSSRPLVPALLCCLLASCGATQRSVAPQPHGLSSLQAGGAGEDLTAFLARATRESESFRRGLLIPAVAGRTQAEVVAQTIASFGQAGKTGTITAARHRPDRKAAEIMRAVAGGSTVDGQEAYGSFAGKWLDSSVDRGVYLHCGEVRALIPPMEVRVDDRSPAVWLQSYQYAWMGDGYGVRLEISLAPQSSERVLLGYVVRVEEGHLERERARQPRVGVREESGALVWIAPGEVIVERTGNESRAAQGQGYTIDRFGYRLEGTRSTLTGTARRTFTSATASDDDLGK